MMFLYASTLYKEEEKWVDFIAGILQKNGEKILKDGKELSDKEARQELKKQAQDIQEWIPIFQKLQII